MRALLVVIVTLATFLIVTFSLWRKRARNISKIKGKLESYWDGKVERRRSIRFKKRLSATCVISEKKESTYHIFSKDISGEGICLQSPEILPEGSPLDLYINIPDHKPIMVKGIVVWVSECPEEIAGEERLFDTGIKFTSIDGRDKQKLNGFLSKEGEKGYE